MIYKTRERERVDNLDEIKEQYVLEDTRRLQDLVKNYFFLILKRLVKLSTNQSLT